MRFLKSSVPVFLAVVLFALALPRPGHAVRLTAIAVLGVRIATPPVSPWQYKFSSVHVLKIQRYSLAELPLPALMRGFISQYSSGWTAAGCWRGGLVADRYFRCLAGRNVNCPGAEGHWLATTTGFAATTGFSESDDLYTANCPTLPQCLDGLDPDYTFVIDLDSGQPLSAGATAGIERLRLTRTEEVGGKDYIQNEWAVVESARGQPSAVRSSSSAFATLGQRVLGEPTDPTLPRRALLIQAPEHIGNTPRPMVRFDPGRTRSKRGTALSKRGTATIRAVFAMDGSLESVETIDGRADAGTLAAGLALEFIPGNEHRTELFAVFELGNEPRVLAAVPVFIQCCCEFDCFPE